MYGGIISSVVGVNGHGVFGRDHQRRGCHDGALRKGLGCWGYGTTSVIQTHRMPRWFSEGLAVYEERRARTGWGADLSPSFVRAYLQGKLPRASRMNETFLRPESPTALVNGYFQASMFIEFVVNEVGFEGVLGMLEGFNRNVPFDEVAKVVLGRNARTMDAQFERFLLKRVASARDALGDGEDDASAYESKLAKAAREREAGDTQAARRTLLEAIQLAPDFADEDSAYWKLAELEVAENDHEAAAATLEAMLGVNADSLAAHALLARTYRELDNAERERETLERALFVQPLDARVHERLGTLYEDAERWSRASAAYEALLSLAPSDAADANFRYARALLRSGKAKRARGAVLRALERAPMYDEALELLLEIREAAGVPNN